MTGVSVPGQGQQPQYQWPTKCPSIQTSRSQQIPKVAGFELEASAAHMGRELTGSSFHLRVSQVSLCRWVDGFGEQRCEEWRSCIGLWFQSITVSHPEKHRAWLQQSGSHLVQNRDSVLYHLICSKLAAFWSLYNQTVSLNLQIPSRNQFLFQVRTKT